MIVGKMVATVKSICCGFEIVSLVLRGGSLPLIKVLLDLELMELYGLTADGDWLGLILR